VARDLSKIDRYCLILYVESWRTDDINTSTLLEAEGDGRLGTYMHGYSGFPLLVESLFFGVM
jgi:hypothetical protein